jgi:hypothetical protein
MTNATRYSLLFILCLLTNTSLAITIAWNNATPLAGQTIDGTQVLIDGGVVGQSATETYDADLSAYAPGQTLEFQVRHFGTVNGADAVGIATPPLAYTIPDTGVPEVAPVLRFHSMADSAASGADRYA